MTSMDTENFTKPLTVSQLIEILKKLKNPQAEVFLNGMDDFYLFAIERPQEKTIDCNSTAYVFSDTSEPFWDEKLAIPPYNLLANLQKE